MFTFRMYRGATSIIRTSRNLETRSYALPRFPNLPRKNSDHAHPIAIARPLKIS